MSHVDNVILAFEESKSADLIARINGWLYENAYHQSFGPPLKIVDAAYGGSKVLEADLYVAAFNYFPEIKFLEFLRTLPWTQPQLVQVMIKRQWDENGWTILGMDGKAHRQGNI